jgi:hypothetical protein
MVRPRSPAAANCFKFADSAAAPVGIAGATVRAPVCSKCNASMRLSSVAPHPQYINLDEWTYTCGCGQTASQLVTNRL